MNGKKLFGQTHIPRQWTEERVEEQEAGSQTCVSARDGVRGVKVKEEEGKEEGSSGFSHPCICPPCLLGCLCVFEGGVGGSQQWTCQHFERFKQDTLRCSLTLVASYSATTASKDRFYLILFNNLYYYYC